MSSQPIAYGDAAALVAGAAAQCLERATLIEELALLDALGRVSAALLLADRDQPPFARSTRDGFAGRAEDWAHGELRLLGLLRAGEAWGGEALRPGQCVEIMTGAPVPAGADCVVMVEHVRRSGERVTLEAGRRIAAGENIVPRGAEARAGAVVLEAGTRLGAHGVAVAAACGYARVPVFRRPRVAIVATGDELVDVGEMPLAHQIRNSNTYTLAAQVRALGGEPVLFSPVADDAAALEAAIGRAMNECDLLLLSGGVSAGRYDLVEPALLALGGEFRFTGVRMQPGKPVVFGSLRGGALPVFGLPGNPVSTLVCFALFAAPVLAALGGERGYVAPFVQARLRGAVRHRPGLTRFLPARLTHAIEGSSVETIAWQGSGDLASTARANCFLVVPEEAGELEDGATVTVLLA